MKTRKIGFAIISIIIFTSFGIITASASSIVNFNDTNLKDALCKSYKHEGDFSEDEAKKVSHDENLAKIEAASISDLEGLQYFTDIVYLYAGGNNLKNLEPLSELTCLGMLDISNNSIKGKSFEKALNEMGRIKKLSSIYLDNDGLTNIKFLGKIGNVDNYTEISMSDNKVNDISILKGATSLETLDLSNNRITDVTPLKNLDKLTWSIDLRDNCIIDYKPIKHLFDKMWEEYDGANAMTRYDYYSNPVNYKYNGKKIKFPYLTVYYKYQGYAEAVPLFKAIGGTATYNKKTGTLICSYDGNEIVMKDFSTSYTINGKKKSLDYPMRRMQYDLAYIPVKDICNILGLIYQEVDQNFFINDDEEPVYAPKLVEISKEEKELG